MDGVRSGGGEEGHEGGGGGERRDPTGTSSFTASVLIFGRLYRLSATYIRNLCVTVCWTELVQNKALPKTVQLKYQDKLTQ